MNDDELSESLRGEVPLPGDGYWDSIDAMLGEVEAEQHAGVSQADTSRKENLAEMETGGEVIRLRSMKNDTSSSPTRNNNTAWFAAAAAALLLIIGVVAVIANRDDDGAVTAVDPDATVDPAVTPEPVVTDPTPEPSPDVQPTPVVEPTPDVSPTPTPIPVVDGAIVDGEPGVIRFIDGPVNSRLEPGLDGEIVATWGGTERGIPTTGRTAFVDGLDWIETEAGEARPRAWVAAQFVVADDGSVDGEVTFFEDDGPGIYVIDAAGELGPDERVTPRLEPGVDAPATGGFWASGNQTASTGRRAQVDGVEWIQLAAGEERPESWVEARWVTRIDQNSYCAVGDGVAVALNFDETGETFTGAIRTNGTGGPFIYEAVAGRRIAGGNSQFDVNVQNRDGGEVTQEIWATSSDGFAVASRADSIGESVPAFACGAVGDQFIELQAAVTTYPPVPA